MKDPNLTVDTASFGDSWRKFLANGITFHVRWYLHLHTLINYPSCCDSVCPSKKRGGKKEEKEEPAALHFTFVAVQSDTNSHAEALVNHGQGNGNLLSLIGTSLGHLTIS